MEFRTHPDEIQALMAADWRRDEELDALNAEPRRHWCPRCNRPTALYRSKGNTWYPDRYECYYGSNCGWWQPAEEYERAVEEALGLRDGEDA